MKWWIDFSSNRGQSEFAKACFTIIFQFDDILPTIHLKSFKYKAFEILHRNT